VSPALRPRAFTNAAFDCPGDDDLEHVLSSPDLVEAIDDTFRIVDGCLDRWTIDHARRGDQPPRVG
jgi:hypothetical protein